MKPDPQRIRAVSCALSSIEAMWVGLPNPKAMKFHVGHLQHHLSLMLDSTPKREARTTKATTSNLPLAPKAPKVSKAPKASKARKPAKAPKALAIQFPDIDLEEALHRLGQPDAFTFRHIRPVASESLCRWLDTKKTSTKELVARQGYVKAVNPRSHDGGWAFRAGNTIAYARCDLSPDDRINAARALVAADRVAGGGREK